MAQTTFLFMACFMLQLYVAWACVDDWMQCGGKGYIGQTCCTNLAFCCSRDNAWWSACRPRSSNQCSFQPPTLPVASKTSTSTAAPPAPLETSISALPASLVPTTSRADVPVLKPTDCKDDWQQCGGIGYSGATCCRRADSCCAKKSDYYSECRADWEVSTCITPATTPGTTTFESSVGTTVGTTVQAVISVESTSSPSTSTTSFSTSTSSSSTWTSVLSTTAVPSEQPATSAESKPLSSVRTSMLVTTAGRTDEPATLVESTTLYPPKASTLLTTAGPTDGPVTSAESATLSPGRASSPTTTTSATQAISTSATQIETFSPLGTVLMNSFWTEAASTILFFRTAPILVSRTAQSTCDVPSAYTDCQLKQILERNCQKVANASKDLQFAITATFPMLYHKVRQKQYWREAGVGALQACQEAYNLTSGFNLTACQASRSDELVEAAGIALNAWGEILMEGRECCALLTAPYCVGLAWSDFTMVLVGILVGALGVIMITSILAARRPSHPAATDDAIPSEIDRAGPITIHQSQGCRTWEGDRAVPSEIDTDGSITIPQSKGCWILSDMFDCAEEGVSSSPGRVYIQLEQGWMRHSCLRVLPSASELAGVTAHVFTSLFEVFDFQADNVRNQHEHLLSMWRSHCSMVADRAVGDDVPVNEHCLLGEALGDLHAELLEGFCIWRWQLRETLNEPEPRDGQLPQVLKCIPNMAFGLLSTVAGASAAELSTQLVEVAVYLLVWGEAGNLRFMPELVYFITHSVLTAGTRQGSGSVQSQRERAGAKSSRFLAEVVRPIYNRVFDEWYDSVEIGPSGKDVKKLHKGFEAFLPADVANYDDWNELFCDQARLVERLRLKDGSRFFDIPLSQRLAALVHVDWRFVLAAEATKTHREIHSIWGVFAATHRICLLHAVLFLASVCAVSKASPSGQHQAWGRHSLSFLVPVGLLVPAHSLLWVVAHWQVTGHAFRNGLLSQMCTFRGFSECLFSIIPLGTYAALRSMPEQSRDKSLMFSVCLGFHYSVSVIGLFLHIFLPRNGGNLWTLTEVPFRKRATRYFFWLSLLSWKFLLGLSSISVIHTAIADLKIMLPGYEAPGDLGNFAYSIASTVNIMLWLLLWITSFLLYIVDTQLWFVLGCTVLGAIIVFVQRKGRCDKFIADDAVAKIPERFSEKVLYYVPKPPRPPKTVFQFAPKQIDRIAGCFAPVWDRIVEYLRYEDNITDEMFGNLSYVREGFLAGSEIANVNWENLTRPLGQEPSPVDEIPREREDGKLCKSGCGRLRRPGLDDSGRPHVTCCRLCRAHDHQHDEYCSGPILACLETPSQKGETSRRNKRRPTRYDERSIKFKPPDIFREKCFCDILFKHYCGVPDPQWPKTPDVQWRIVALARSLGLEMPRPFRAPYLPGLTVLIPHYGETIILRKDELFQQEKGIVPLMDWVKDNWTEEFGSFTSRMQAACTEAGEKGIQSNPIRWRMLGTQWDEYSDEQWERLCSWSSMRMQTLWRTVAGMCLYHPALQCHYEAQGIREGCQLAHPTVWDPSDCFTCLVSMQMYKFFDKGQLEDTNRMLQKFPSCLNIAFIDNEEKGSAGDADSVHGNQHRRYYSCLIDRSCKDGEDGLKIPRYRIELPGYPILGDGKSDNQNHAIPFMRGTLSQCIDANQGAYFEQMLLLPCALGEFRSHKRGDGMSKRIIGLPEHITSDIGSVGDMAASAEQAFGTILQRSYAVLGVRMHYGHPDIMNKLCMMQQGGVSKATKTLNLSEDIFAGMDFTLRGDGREIRHCEYFHLAKGRDLGFNTVLAFFSKLASGCGEQFITRQVLRLSAVFHLPECLGFYYAHVGYYLNQFFISFSCPLIVFCWLLVLLSDCEGTFDAFQHCTRGSAEGLQAAKVMAETLSMWFSWLLVLFFAATSLPLLVEIWMERSLKIAVMRVLKQILTLSPLLFIFQSKVIGSYVVNELRVGGATYVSTGRGLPTERRAFIGEPETKGLKLKKVGGLYLDYASIAYYDGASLLGACVLVLMSGGMRDLGVISSELTWTWISMALVIASWLYAPFLFNPYQFVFAYFRDDLRSWLAFFTENGGMHWVAWYEQKQLKARAAGKIGIDITMFLTIFLLSTCYSLVSLKLDALVSSYSQAVGSVDVLRLASLAPPIGASLLYCVLLSIAARCCRCLQRRPRRFSGVLPRSVREGSAEQQRCRSDKCVHMALSALCILVLDVFEACFALKEFYFAGWQKALIAGFLLKFALVATCIRLGEFALRVPCLNSFEFVQNIVEMWVHFHRMSRDILTSTLILSVLVPLVIVNTLNDCMCHGCSVHQLLIYRNTGTKARTWQEWQKPQKAGTPRRFYDTSEKSEADSIAV